MLESYQKNYMKIRYFIKLILKSLIIFCFFSNLLPSSFALAPIGNSKENLKKMIITKVDDQNIKLIYAFVEKEKILILKEWGNISKILLMSTLEKRLLNWIYSSEFSKNNNYLSLLSYSSPSKKEKLIKAIKKEKQNIEKTHKDERSANQLVIFNATERMNLIERSNLNLRRNLIKTLITSAVSGQMNFFVTETAINFIVQDDLLIKPEDFSWGKQEVEISLTPNIKEIDCCPLIQEEYL